MLRRILLIALMIGLVLGEPLPARSAGKIIGVVFTSDAPRYKEAHRAFLAALSQKGYEPQDLELVVQSPNPDPISWANAIRKLAAIDVGVIVSYGAPVTLSALREGGGTPVIFADVYGPVEIGITKSLSSPPRNVTGISSKVPVITLVKTITELKPVHKLGILHCSREQGSVVQLQEIRRAAAQRGFSVIEGNVTTPAALDGTLKTLLSQVDALFVTECSTICRSFERIVQKATSHRVPVISPMPEAASKGALVSLEISPLEQGQAVAEHLVRYLTGNKPSQIPIITPRKVELIINLKMARALDITVPFQVLSEATKVLK